MRGSPGLGLYAEQSVSANEELEIESDAIISSTNVDNTKIDLIILIFIKHLHFYYDYLLPIAIILLPIQKLFPDYNSNL
jgi:hypothetical protein